MKKISDPKGLGGLRYSEQGEGRFGTAREPLASATGAPEEEKKPAGSQLTHTLAGDLGFKSPFCLFLLVRATLFLGASISP